MRISILILAMNFIAHSTTAQFTKAYFHTNSMEKFEPAKKVGEYKRISSENRSLIFKKDSIDISVSNGDKYILIGEPTVENVDKITHFKYKAWDSHFKSCEFWLSFIKGKKNEYGKYDRNPKAITIFYKQEDIFCTYYISKTESKQQFFF